MHGPRFRSYYFCTSVTWICSTTDLLNNVLLIWQIKGVSSPTMVTFLIFFRTTFLILLGYVCHLSPGPLKDLPKAFITSVLTMQS